MPRCLGQIIIANMTTAEHIPPTIDTETKVEFKSLLRKYFTNRPDAFNWLVAFWNLGHQIDDVIDIPERRADNAYLGLVWNKYIDVLSDPFYQRYVTKLHPIVKVVHHTYFDSLAWEKSETSWKATFADVLRCNGSALIIAVVEIVVYEETGSYDLAYEAAREVSMIAKQCAWEDHHAPDGKPI